MQSYCSGVTHSTFFYSNPFLNPLPSCSRKHHLYHCRVSPYSWKCFELVIWCFVNRKELKYRIDYVRFLRTPTWWSQRMKVKILKIFYFPLRLKWLYADDSCCFLEISPHLRCSEEILLKVSSQKYLGICLDEFLLLRYFNGSVRKTLTDSFL